MNSPRRFLIKSACRLLCFAGLCCLVACDSKAPPPAPKLDAPQPSPETPKPAAVEPERRPGPEEILVRAAAQPVAPFEGEDWKPLFDGKTLSGWKETDFAGHGAVECTNGIIVLNMGDPFTGINWTNPPPKGSYEVALDAMRVMGTDFFCGLTVPVRDSCCSLIVGGWGGGLVGISSIDGYDASENETTHMLNFETGKWYRIRVRVTPEKIQVWIDKEKLIDVVIKDRKVCVRPGDIEMSQPFGIASWQTGAAFREVRLREFSE